MKFLRNETVDAKNFFDPTDQEKPPFKRHQYGFALGGPIRRDKAFLFGDLEFTDIRESATIVSTVPNLAEKAGDFSAGSTIIYDPLTYDLTANARQPFPEQRAAGEPDRFCLGADPRMVAGATEQFPNEQLRP